MFEWILLLEVSGNSSIGETMIKIRILIMDEREREREGDFVFGCEENWDV